MCRQTSDGKEMTLKQTKKKYYSIVVVSLNKKNIKFVINSSVGWAVEDKKV